MSAVPPNWYPDPMDDRHLRYWDGTAWTEDRMPVSAVQPTSPRAARSEKVPLLGSRGYAKRQAQDLAAALAEIQQLRAQLVALGGLEVAELQRKRDQFAVQIATEQSQLDSLRSQIIATSDERVLQEIGIYEYRHPLSDAVAYRDELKHLQGEIKDMARRDGGAIEAPKAWVVEGSVTNGRRMVREYSTLMLRAYNAEADNLVRSLKPYKLKSALDRLNKMVTAFEKLGRTMEVRVAPAYHQLRCRELEMTADYLETVARQKEREREERDRMREERKVQEELARERAIAEKDRQRYLAALATLESSGSMNTESAEDLQAKLKAVDERVISIDYREKNLRAGYIYVISNIGAFGDRMVQIGLTRRWDPRERIRELGSTAVPFRYDEHTVFLHHDAVGLEEEIHRRLAHKRVNMINRRREFFYATPAEVREHLEALAGQPFEFNDLAEAVEFRQSRAAARDMAADEWNS
ncbi:DUF4041 domain-containing protein [Nocardia vulneris]|uniref:DUF4041 domain-containing protein n=1 Tax=Nocardia vulneris TaxID=1141657 RepID=UPI0009E25381|nr:DUF4041 domain-containing protein [Nocardia vulneris]